jgi:hypothetical protein
MIGQIDMGIIPNLKEQTDNFLAQRNFAIERWSSRYATDLERDNLDRIQRKTRELILTACVSLIQERLPEVNFP